MAGAFDFYKSLGIDEKDIRNMSDSEIMDFIAERAKEQKKTIMSKEQKVFIENAKTELPKIKEQFQKPIQVFVKSVGQTKSAKAVRLVGYNMTNNSYLVITTGEKVYTIPADEIITDESDLSEGKTIQKGTRAKIKV